LADAGKSEKYYFLTTLFGHETCCELLADMKTENAFDDEPATDFEGSQLAGTATLEMGEPFSDTIESEWDSPCCEKCELPLKSDVVSICRNCGWYPSLGTYVELDEEYEALSDPEKVEAKPQPSHLEI
jgi:hypothetical protein